MRLNTILAALLAMMLTDPAAAGPFEDGRSAYDRQDFATALQLFRLAADQGNAGGQYNLGRMYDNGQGVPKDYSQAMKWYRLAADQHDAVAQSNLGSLYYTGRGVPKDC